MRILVAPDSFKDALPAAEVARSLARGIEQAVPEADVQCLPLGDGGEGTGGILAAALSATAHDVVVLDPHGRPLHAQWWLAADGATAIVELAEASGLMLLTPEERDPLQTSTFGTGQLLRAARSAGCRRVLLCVGGSATVDGGAGCLHALGWQILDRDGALMDRVTGGRLRDVARVLPPPNPRELDIEILCDVDNPLVGARGAAEVFGPQKGATPTTVPLLADGLRHWAEVLAQATGCDVRGQKHGGAAGGLPAGLAAACGARLVSGFDALAERVDFADAVASCDVCLTGEGRIDDQTAGGKVVAGVTRLAGARNVPVIVFVGAADLPANAAREEFARSIGAADIVVITPTDEPLDVALRNTGANLEAAAAQWMRGWGDRS